jgi:uncharacterized membrane protein
MRKLANFVKVTIAGGILFLVPVGAIVFVMAKLFDFLRSLASPIVQKFHFTRILGVGPTTLISIVLLLLACFLAGIFMRTQLAKRIVKWLENRVLVYIPGYAYIQARSAEWFSDERTNNWKAATVFIDDNEVLCFVIDESDEFCSIFLPSAPMPSSGTVSVRAKNIVTYLPISVSEAVSMIRQFGKGAAEVIRKAQPTKRPG